MNHNIAVILSANATSFRSQMAVASASVSEFSKRAEAAGKSGLSKFAFAMKTAAAIGVVALGAALASGVQQFAKFEKAMYNVQSISHLSEAAFQRLSQQTLNLSKQLPQDATTLAEGLYQIASSGYQGADGLAVLTQSAKAASAGLTTTEVAAKAIVAVMNAYGRGVEDVTDISDTLFQTVNIGILSFEELATQIGDVVGMAAAAGVQIDEVGAAMAAMTLSGISAAESSTSLARLIQKIIQPSKALKARLSDLGYESGLAALEQDHLYGVMEKLRISTGGSVEEFLRLFPEIRAARGAFALAANGGLNYKKAIETVADAHARANATQKALNEQMKSFSAQMTLMKNRINAGLINAGRRAVPVLLDMARGAEKLLDATVRVGQGIAQKLVPFFHSAVNIGENLVEIFDQMWDAVGPLLKALAGIALGGTIMALSALGDALEAVTGFMKKHEGIATALSILLATKLAYGFLTSATMATRFSKIMGMLKWANMGDGMKMLALRASYLKDAFANLFMQFSTGPGFITSLKGAFQGLGPAIVGGAGIAFAVGELMALTRGLENAKAQAKEMVNELSGDIRLNNIIDMDRAVDRLYLKMQHVQEELYGQDRDLGFFEVVTKGAKGTLQMLTPLKNTVVDNAKAAKELGNAAHDTANKMAMVKHNAGALGSELGVFSGTVMEVATQLGLDLSKHLDPEVFAEYEEKLGNVLLLSHEAPKVEQLGGAFATLGDEVSSSTDKVKAFKDAIDSLLGIQKNVFDATTDAQKAVKDFTKELTDGELTFSEFTDAGLANRDALSDMTDQYIDLANAVAENDGIDAGVKVLQDYRAQVVQMLSDAGMGKEAIDDLLTSIGLTPETIDILLKTTGVNDAKREYDAMIAKAKELDEQKPTAKANVDTSKFDFKTKQLMDAVGIMNYLKPTPKADLDKSKFDNSATAVGTRIIMMSQMRARPRAELDTSFFTLQLARFRAQLAAASSPITIKVNGVTTTRPSPDRNGRWGMLTSYRSGGIHQAHVAVGDVIRYAEPGTGGEAYIPRLGNRMRSEDILKEAAGWYGLRVIPMSEGGVVGSGRGGSFEMGGVTVDMRGATVYGVEDLEGRIKKAVATGQREAAVALRKKAPY